MLFTTVTGCIYRRSGYKNVIYLNVPKLKCSFPSGFVLLPCAVDLLVERHGERHPEQLYDQHTHSDGSQKVFVVIQPLLHLLIATVGPEDVGGVASTALEDVLAAAIRNHVLMQSSVPVLMVHHTTALPLSLDGVPRVLQALVVFRVVQNQTFFQVLSGIFTHLVGVDEEEDEEDQLGQENDQQNDEEAQQQALVLLDGAQATQEPGDHDDGAQGDDEVGGGERREGGRQGGEAALRHGQPHADSQQPTAPQPEEQVEEEEHVLHAADAAASHD